MRRAYLILANENGSVLVVSVLVLLLLTIIGIYATTTTDIELRISGNEKLAKIAFYEADGGTEFCRELLEQNLACPEGFPTVTNETYAIIPPGETHGVIVDTPKFWENEPDVQGPSLPGDANRDIHIPYESDVQVDDDNAPHTNLTVEGVTKLATGSAIHMAAGYEGKGKGTASGGAHMLFDIFSQRMGRANSRACVCIEYRHLVGDEDECMYPGAGGILQ